MVLLRTDRVAFRGRAERTAYLAAAFGQALRGRVLDIGCDRRVLASLRPDLDYVGLDTHSDAEVCMDLEAADRLPFEDGEFDCVVCADVLEHLDGLHRVFCEAVRVSRRFLLLSLPNCWAGARRPIERGKGSIAHYGLPVDAPADRHKWFFSLSEARSFVLGSAARHRLAVRELRACEKPRAAVLRALRRLRYPSHERYLNRYAHTLCALLEKEPSAI